MTAPTTFELYKKLAVERPAKAIRYRRSITDTLGRENIHELERARLTDALAGIAAGLVEHPICERCHRELSDPDSIAAGLGSHCQKVAS